MLRERILALITILFSIVCSIWFVCLIMDSRRNASMLNDSSRMRYDRACEQKEGDIKIGAVLNSTDELSQTLKEALVLAQQQVNTTGVLGGRKIDLVFKDDSGAFSNAREIAQGFADDLDFNLVLGHFNSGTTMNVLPIYEFYGILLFSPSASSPRLTRSVNKMFVRNAANDQDLAEAMSSLCDQKKFRRVVVVFPDNTYGRGMANAIESQASVYGVDVVDRKVFVDSDPQFEKILRGWRDTYHYDAVIAVFNSFGSCEKYLNVSAEQNCRYPVLLAPDMTGIAAEAKKHKEWPDIYLFDTKPVRQSSSTEADTREFFRKFKEKTGKEPTYIDYNGYDALIFLARAIEEAGSPAAAEVSRVLRSGKIFDGAGGNIAFSAKGDALREFSAQLIHNGTAEKYQLVEQKKEIPETK